MERIAIISDIHGNITALKTVLEDIHNRRDKKNLLCRRFSSKRFLTM